MKQPGRYTDVTYVSSVKTKSGLLERRCGEGCQIPRSDQMAQVLRPQNLDYTHNAVNSHS